LKKAWLRQSKSNRFIGFDGKFAHLAGSSVYTGWNINGQHFRGTVIYSGYRLRGKSGNITVYACTENSIYNKIRSPRQFFQYREIILMV
jgi:hypothetical protein